MMWAFLFTVGCAFRRDIKKSMALEANRLASGCFSYLLLLDAFVPHAPMETHVTGDPVILATRVSPNVIT